MKIRHRIRLRRPSLTEIRMRQPPRGNETIRFYKAILYSQSASEQIKAANEMLEAELRMPSFFARLMR